MQLIRTLLLAVAALVILAGLSVIFGCSKQQRMKGFRFFLACLGASAWTIAIMIFLGLSKESADIAPLIVVWIIGGITLCDVMLLAYLSWEYKNGKLATLLFGLMGIGIVVALALKSDLFYSEIALGDDVNRIFVDKGWYYILLIVYFFAISITFSNYLNQRIKVTADKGLKTGLKIFYVGLSVGGILALIFDLVLLTKAPNWIWVGPMATSISILSFYYSVVKYRVISISSQWMRVMSYAILGATGVILYILVFYAVFTALFHIPNPSGSVMLLNFIMTAILLCLIPAINEISGILRGAINYDKIQFHYILKKLENISPEDIDMRDIAKFLADNMHYSYIGFIVNDRAYFSENIKMGASEISHIYKMEDNLPGYFLTPDRADLKICEAYDISKIGVLYDKNRKMFGKIVFGKKMNRMELSNRDLAEYEAIINITAAVIEDGSRKS